MECPEFVRGADGGGRGVKAVPMHRERTPRPGGIRGGLAHDEHPWGFRRGVSASDKERVGVRKTSKLEWDFVLQDVVGELVMTQDCPEFSRGVDPTPSAITRCHLSAPGGEDTAAGQRGTPTLDLDPSSAVPHAGRRMDLTHNLVLSAPAHTPKENPSELVYGFVLQETGGEMLTRRERPEFSPLKMGFTQGNGRQPGLATPDPGISGKRTGWCRPFRAEDFLLCVPGVLLRATPGYSNGIPPGCTVMGICEIPGSMITDPSP